jgi:outer membrane protein assembly factor BamC
MRKALAIMTVTLLSTSLSGCGWLFGDDGIFRDRGNDYRRARLEPVMQVPEGMSRAAIENEFDIPEIKNSEELSPEFITPRPAKLDVVPDSVRINKLGKQQWILADATPAELWAQVRTFLNASKISVDRAEATSGQIETAWLQPANPEQAEERYQFIVDQGVQRGTSEVRVIQAVKAQNPVDWPQYSDDAGREDAMLRELAQYLADAGAAGAVSMLAQRGFDDGGRLTLIPGANGSDPSLQLKLSFERSWAALESALERGQFAVEDRNFDQKVFWVKALPELEEEVVEEEKGWFSWLTDWFDDDEEQSEVVESSSASKTRIVQKQPRWWDWSAEETRDFPILQVGIEMDEQNLLATIRVADSNGKALNPEQATNLLNRIKRYLR